MEISNLFNINQYTINTEDFSHLLHDDIENVLCQEFAAYVGAKHAAVANSASSLMFLALDGIIKSPKKIGLDKKPIFLPSMIPPAVASVVHNSRFPAVWRDDVDWIGKPYVLYNTLGIEPDMKPRELHADKTSPQQQTPRMGLKIIDSSQQVTRDLFRNEANPQDIMIFSFYPTKPVGGIDGGIVVSDNKEAIDFFNIMVHLGSDILKTASVKDESKALNKLDSIENEFEWSEESEKQHLKQGADEYVEPSEENFEDAPEQKLSSWERVLTMPGWKMHANSIQCYIALQNLRKLDAKNAKLQYIRTMYNTQLGLENDSFHLYRVNVKKRDETRESLLRKGIATGIHYDPLHNKGIYDILTPPDMQKTNEESKTTISIPFHEKLSEEDVSFIIQNVRPFLV